MSQHQPRRPLYAGICPNCNAGSRGACDCPYFLPAEAATDVGADGTQPIGHPPLSFLLGPFIDRWPRFFGLAASIAIVLVYALAGDPPELLEPLATPYLPGDGIPAELLAAEQAASEVQR